MKKILCTILIVFFSCQALANEKITLILDWFANPNHAPLFVAEEQGYFKAEGLDVTFINPADPNDPPKLVAAKQADIGITYQPQFLEQVDQGLPLMALGVLIKKPLNCLMSLEKLEHLKDLKGKKIASSGAPMDSLILSIALEHAGLTLSDVDHINAHYGLMQALLSHQVDAVTGVMRNFEVTQIKLSGKTPSVFYPEDYGVPSYAELIFVIHPDALHEKKMAGFLRALEKAEAYLQKHPEESYQAFIKSHPENNNRLNHDAWMLTLPYFSLQPGHWDSKSFIHFANFMQKNQMIHETKPLKIYLYKANQGKNT